METECTSWGQRQTETDLLMECYCSWDTNSRAKKTNSTPQVFEMSCRRPRCCCCCCCCWVPLCYHTGSFIWEGFLDNVLLMLFKHSLFAKLTLVCSLFSFGIFYFYCDTSFCTKWAWNSSSTPASGQPLENKVTYKWWKETDMYGKHYSKKV